MKGEKSTAKITLPSRVSKFKTDGEIKNFTNKEELRKLSTTKQALQQMLKGLL